MTHDLYDPQPLIDRVHAYAKAKGISPATASARVFGEGDRLSGLESGRSCTLATATKAMQRLDELFKQLAKPESV